MSRWYAASAVGSAVVFAVAIAHGWDSVAAWAALTSFASALWWRDS